MTAQVRWRSIRPTPAPRCSRSKISGSRSARPRPLVSRQCEARPRPRCPATPWRSLASRGRASPPPPTRSSTCFPGTGKVTGGEVLFEGRDLSKLDRREIERLRGTKDGVSRLAVRDRGHLGRARPGPRCGQLPAAPAARSRERNARERGSRTRARWAAAALRPGTPAGPGLRLARTAPMRRWPRLRPATEPIRRWPLSTGLPGRAGLDGAGLRPMAAGAGPGGRGRGGVRAVLSPAPSQHAGPVPRNCVPGRPPGPTLLPSVIVRPLLEYGM